MLTRQNCRAGLLAVGHHAHVEHALRSRLDRWFSAVDVEDAHTGAPVEEALRQLAEMLDTLAPVRVNRDRSTIRSHGHGWRAHGVSVDLAHDTNPEADLCVGLDAEGAIVAWLDTHKHVFPDDGDDSRPWTTVVADVVAAALRGEYQVERHYRGDRLVKTRIVDIAVPGNPRDLGTTASLFGWLRRGPTRVERKRLDYGIPSETSP